MFKCEPYLKKCLDHLVGQTLKEIEIICVDDGSPDKSAEIVQEYQKNDSRIRLVTQKNKGQAVAQNLALKQVKTPYVMFCDADDFYDFDMCEKMLKALIESKSDIVCCGIKPIYLEGEKPRRGQIEYYAIKFDGKCSVTQKNVIQTNVFSWNKIFKMDVINKNHIQFPEGLTHTDTVFFVEYMTASQSIYYLPEKLHNYVRHSDSVMGATYRKNMRALDFIKVMKVLYDYLRKRKLLKKWCDVFLMLLMSSIRNTKLYLPEGHKDLFYSTLWPLMKKFSEKEVALLPPTMQKSWCQLLRQCYNKRFFFKKR